MNNIDKDSARTIMLNMMDEIHLFCEKNSIRYYLAFGTLLGAIRHKGFIPWDDDMDIMMPRPDYERFVRLYSAKGKYNIHTPYQKHPLYYYSKVYDDSTIKIEEGISYKVISALGVDVDIFPIYGLPTAITDIQIERDKFYRAFLYRMRNFAIGPISMTMSKRHPYFIVLLGGLLHIIGNRFLMRLYIANASKYKYETADRVAELGSRVNIFKKKDFEDWELCDFEGRHYRVPKGYDNILFSSYGNYMKLPPEEDRVSHHGNAIYWKESRFK